MPIRKTLLMARISVICLGVFAAAIVHAQSGTGELGSFNFDGSNPTSGLVATGAPAISTLNSHTPPNSLSLPAGNNYETYTLPSATSVLYTRQYMDISSIGSTSNAFLRLYHGSSELMSFFLNASAAHPSYYNQATGVTTTMSSTPFPTGSIHLVELYVKMSATAGQVICKIDGTTVYTSVATLNTSTSTIDTVWFGQIGNVGTPPVGWGTTYMDNVDFSAINWIGPINPSSGTGELGSFNFDGSNPTSGLVATGAPAISTLNSHTPPNSLSFPAGNNYEVYTLPSATSVLYTRQYMDISSIGSNSHGFLRLYHGGSELMSIFLNATDAHPSYYNQAAGTTTTMSSTAFPTGSVHLVELYVKMSATAGQVICKIDGTTDYTSAATLNTGTSTIDTVWFGQIGNTATPPVGWGTTYMDNVDFSAINWIGPINVAVPPAFSPAPGTYTAAQVVSLTDGTTGANIYYTTDGSTPTSASSLYTQSINVGSTQTLQAIAIAANYANSAVAVGNYTIVIPPTLSGLSPSSGVVGASVTISGSNFGASQGSSTVSFNGTAATPSSWSATSIMVPVPSGATTGNVVVTVGGTSSNGSLFTVIQAPAITGLSPSSGVVGTSVTISGSNFGASQGTSTVKFNGTSATPTSWSASSIVVPVPTGATTGNVVVTVGGNSSNGSLFTMIQAPAISGLSPASGVVGTSVTISGSNFGASQGTSTVKLNGTSATPTSWSATSIVVPVPSGATTGNVVVTVGGNSSNSSLFTVIQPPAISGLSMSSGVVGTSVTISGSNFGASQGTSTVSFNGTSATPTSWSDTSIVVPVPSGATTGNVVMTVGGNSSNGSLFTVIQPPAISGLSPSSGAVGTSVTISGSNFGASQGTSAVSFNGTSATPSSWSVSSIIVPVPSGATTGNVVVTVSGNSSNGSLFTVIQAPGISGLSPSSGVVGTSVTISGSNFGASQGMSTVSFNGTSATPSSWSATSIVVSVPSGATTGNVVVTVGGQSSNGSLFTVIQAPGISGLSPSSGVVGTSVTISGSNFGASQGTSTVKFNGTSATPTNWSATSIAVPVPSGATTGNIVVTVSGNSSNSSPFTVIQSPAISGLSPSSGAVGTSVTISGSNFGASQGTSTVSFNGTTATPSSWSVTSIVVPVPTGATTGNVVVTVGGSSSNGSLFTVVQAPAISGLSPGSGAVGTSVTISGSNFGASQGTSAVSFNGTSATPSSWNDTSIVVPVPSGATTGNVIVTVNGGSSNGSLFTVSSQANTRPVSFTYDALNRLIGVVDASGNVATYSYDAVGNILSISRNTPGQVTIINFSPSSGPTGTMVTISGAGFSANPAQNAVTFGSVTATIVSSSSTQIVVSVPPGAASGSISVTSPSGSATAGSSFIVTTGSTGTLITSFSPTIGAVGTPVIISGSGFDVTQGNDRLQFNVSSQPVLTATPTSLSATVPESTGSGHISVMTPNGEAISNQDLFIPLNGAAASSIGYTTRISAGSSATVSLGAGQIGQVLFDATAGDSVDVTTSNSSSNSCSVILYDPHAQFLGSSTCTAGNDLAPANPLPVSGTYTLQIEASSPSSVTLTINDATAATDVPVTIDGPPMTVTTTASGKTPYLTFKGSAGQHLLLGNSNYSSFSNCTLFLYYPNISQPAQFNCYTSSLDLGTLGYTGTYRLQLRTGTSMGSASLQLTSISDVTSTLTIDGPSQRLDTNPSPFQSSHLKFYSSGGQHVLINITNDYYSSNSCTINLYDPNGFAVNGGTGYCAGYTDVLSVDLFASGTYTLVITWTHASVQLTSVADLTATIAIDGPPVGVTTSAPYQGAKLTFPGIEGQHVMLQVSGATFSQCELSVYKPNGVLLVTPLGSVDYYNGCSGGAPLTDIPSLPASGTYTILVVPYGPATGSVTLQLSSVASVPAGSITIDGPAVTVSTAAAGQVADLTFRGTAGQVIVPVQVDGTFNHCDVSLFGPPGTGVLLKATDCPDWKPITLPASGTYTFAIGDSFSAGTLTLQLISVPPDVIGGAVTVDGAPVTVSFTSPWQGADLTFIGVGGSQVEVSTSSSPANFNCCSAQVILGNDSKSGSGSSDLYDLWADGTYTLKLHPSSGIGSVTVQLIKTN
jgi:YD repeat-containing protein